MNNIKRLKRQIEPALVHTAYYEEYAGQDRNHKATFKSGIKIKKCRVDIERTYVRNSSTENITISAVLYMCNGVTVPFVPLKEKSRVFHNGKTYRILKIVECTEPFNDDLFSYEVELVDA